ncbi:hypothetical protein STA3757_11030 [Stanieria sp. NIES-3757]|nr:hypothetical protein STA3757_11030 [Stanieria sp. NIES-3757]
MRSGSLIQIEKIKVSRQQNLPDRVCFQFNDSLLRDIQLWRETNKKLQLPSDILTDFRYLVLINQQKSFSVELNFCSFYQQNEEKIAVIQSKISLDGKINQQIRHDYLQEPQLLQRIITAHYWLIEQMLNQLKLKLSSDRKKQTPQSHLDQKHQFLSWSLSLGLTMIVAAMLILASINLPVVLIIIVLLTFLGQLFIKRFLFPNFFDSVIQKLLNSRIFSSAKKSRLNYPNKLK